MNLYTFLLGALVNIPSGLTGEIVAIWVGKEDTLLCLVRIGGNLEQHTVENLRIIETVRP